MNILSKCILALLGAFLVVPVLTASEAGDDSARYYKSNPDKYDGKVVDVDVAFVSRINRKTGIDGVVFFLAHTVDEDNRGHGGIIVVAILEDEADNFMRKYGTAIERRGEVDSKRMRGTFHVLERGRVYIDESGEADALIEAHRKEHGDAAIPGDDDGVPSAGNKKKKKF